MTESDWYLIIQDWEKSGLTQQDFCIRNNLAYNNFKHWRTKGISEGLFTASSRWRHKLAEEFEEPLSFTRIDNIEPEVKPDSKYMELCLPYGITLKLPV
jgi:hypothetical protein